MASQGLFLCSFIPKNHLDAERIVEMVFTDSFGEDDGFILNEYTSSFIDAIFIISFIAKEFVYIPQNRSFEPVETKRRVPVPFSVNLEKNRIEIWGSKTNAQKLITSLAVSLNNQVVIDSISISLERVLINLKKHQISIGKVKVENVVFEKKLIASCTFDLSNHDTPYSILEKYKNDILQVSASIKNGDDAVTITFYANGSITIYKQKEFMPSEIMSKLIDICLG